MSIARNSKKAVLWRTKWQNADGSYRLVAEKVLRDDPKNGIHDLRDYKRRFASFEGRHVSRAVRPDNYTAEDAEAEQKRRDRFDREHPVLDDYELAKADEIFNSLKDSVFEVVIRCAIADNRLNALYHDEALEAALDAVRRGIRNYDPEHPPKVRLGVKPEDVKPASLKTFLAICGRNAIMNFARLSNGEKAGGWAIRVPISNQRPVDAAENGEISVEAMPAEARYDQKMVELVIDCAIVRRMIYGIYGKTILDVFDKRLAEFDDAEIYQELGVTPGVFRTRYLRPFQRLVDMMWIQSNLPEREWK